MTVAPDAAVIGVELVIVGGGVKVIADALFALPPGVVTAITPLAPPEATTAAPSPEQARFRRTGTASP